MKSGMVLLIALIAVAVGAAGGYWFGHRGADKGTEGSGEAKAEEKPAPVATVRVAPLRRGTIFQEVTVYGTVISPASEVQVVSVPFESRVARVLVTPGQTVANDQPLIVVQASAATTLAFQEARNAENTAERDLQAVKARYEQKLATNTDLNAAENALRTAQARLQNLQQAGAEAPAVLKSMAAGSISKIDVQGGQIVPAGGPLVEIAPQNRVEVKLAVDPQDAAFLKDEQTVSLRKSDRPEAEPVTGIIRLISQRIDPTTRLVDVFVKLPADAKFALDSFVTARVATRSVADALIAPREAVLPGDGEEFELFTIKDAKAVKHTVHVGLDNDRELQITAEDLKAGENVVIMGNAELEEGMKVEIAPPATQPSASSPSTVSRVKVETVADSRIIPSPGTPGEGWGGGFPVAKSRFQNLVVTRPSRPCERCDEFKKSGKQNFSKLCASRTGGTPVSRRGSETASKENPHPNPPPEYRGRGQTRDAATISSSNKTSLSPGGLL